MRNLFKRAILKGSAQNDKAFSQLLSMLSITFGSNFSLVKNNMACDYGYKVIVLLAGMTDSLRQQTQDRIDEGFIGATNWFPLEYVMQQE